VRGGSNSSTMIVMIIAGTPLLNASSRIVFIFARRIAEVH